MAHAAADRYASALYELAVERNVVQEVGVSLNEARSTLTGDGDLGRRFFDRRTKSAGKKGIIAEHLAPGRHPYVGNLLHLLVDKNRVDLFLAIVLSYFERLEEEQDILRVQVESALPLDDSQAQRLVEQLSQATGKQVVPEIRVVPELIAGMRLFVGSRLIDGTVRSRIERLGERLKAAV